MSRRKVLIAKGAVALLCSILVACGAELEETELEETVPDAAQAGVGGESPSTNDGVAGNAQGGAEDSANLDGEAQGVAPSPVASPSPAGPTPTRNPSPSPTSVPVDTPRPTALPVSFPVPSSEPAPGVPGVTGSPVPTAMPSALPTNPTPEATPQPSSGPMEPVAPPGLPDAGEGFEGVAVGEELWSEKGCIGCHDQSLNEDVADAMVRDALHRGRADFVSTVTDTMPFGSPSACASDCAEALADWLYSLYPEVDDSLPPESPVAAPTPPAVPVGQGSLMKSLHKAAIGLGFEFPRERWQSRVAEAGEAGLEAVVREIMEEDNFYQRLREVYSPTLQGTTIPSNAYAESIGGRANWFNDYKGLDPDNSRARHARWAIYHAINDEPLHLIEYVVRNNLPFTEILTAEYTLVNYYSARAYNLLEELDFTVIDNPEYEDFPYDSKEYKKAYLPLPTAGILSSSVFVTRYPTNEGNVNRHRAYQVFKLFLDTDILDIPGSRVAADDITVDNPTLNNPTCTGCHQVMDPVSSSFRHWQRGEVRRDDWQKAGWDQSTILPPGFNGKAMPAEHTAPLQWLAQQIAGDPRFAVATVKTLFTPVTGHPILAPPGDGASDAAKWRYSYQQEQIAALAEDFIAGGYQVKELVVDLVLSDYFRDEDYLGGTSKLLDGEQLKRKVQATLAIEDLAGVGRIISQDSYFGDQPSGIMTLLQRLAASDFTCRAVAPDLLKAREQRQLLPYFQQQAIFDDSGAPTAAKQDDVKRNLQHLMWRLWGQKVSLESAELLSLYDVYFALLRAGQQAIEEGDSSRLPGMCDAQSDTGTWVRDDPDYAIRAWIAVVNLMLDDFQFLYD